MQLFCNPWNPCIEAPVTLLVQRYCTVSLTESFFFLKVVFCFCARIGFYKFLDTKQRNYFKRPNATFTWQCVVSVVCVVAGIYRERRGGWRRGRRAHSGTDHGHHPSWTNTQDFCTQVHHFTLLPLQSCLGLDYTSTCTLYCCFHTLCCCVLTQRRWNQVHDTNRFQLKLSWGGGGSDYRLHVE